MNKAKHYNWNEIKAYYDEGHSLNECKAKFGFHHAAWTKAVNRGDIKPRLTSGNVSLLPVEKLKSRYGIKQRLLKTGELKYECAICGNKGEHLGLPLPLELDHISGDNTDNRLENLRLLCPNCHAQTPTSGSKNAKRRREGKLVDTEVFSYFRQKRKNGIY